MNVPVPPIFLYETALGRFEVMDGQQRLNTVVEYLQNRFELKGLEIWPDLNARRFSDLPNLVARGLERSKISAIILVSDSGEEGETSIDLRAQVFDRINSGGERLNAQELRNSLYHGPFNDLIVELSGWRTFTDTWSIPPHYHNDSGEREESPELKNNNLYKRMIDTEIVLRYFAFRTPKFIRGSVQSMLTETMKRYRNIDEDRKDRMEATYKKVFSACLDVYGDRCFKIEGTDGKLKLSRPLYDAQMVAMYRHRERIEDIKSAKSAIQRATSIATSPTNDSYPLIVGRANTADAIKKRCRLISKIIEDAI